MSVGGLGHVVAVTTDHSFPGPCHRRDFPYRETMNDEVLSSSEALTFDDLLVVPGWSLSLIHI